MNFIEKLPSSSRFDTILVIVDQLTKQVIFISAHDIITSANLAHLFILYVFSKHSISSHVILDRDSEFVFNLFHYLSTALDMWLYFTLVYHPKDDGQTKYTNQTLKQYLLSLFFTNKKYYPNITIHSKYNIASSQAHNFTNM